MKSWFMAATAALALTAFSIDAASAERLRGARQNAAGGVTAGSVHNTQGPNGGRSIGRRGLITDGEGNGVARSANCASGGAGRACRAGYTTRTADGAVNHQSGAAFEGANGGSGSTQGGFSRNADGTYSGDRSTSATGAQGNSYNADTTYDSETGVSRSVSCTDASGAAISCPTR